MPPAATSSAPSADAGAGAGAGATCGVTVLQTVGKARATKRWRWSHALGEWSKVTYEAGARFRATEYLVSSLAELVAILERIRRDPCAFVVRGELQDEARQRLAADADYTIRRRKHFRNGIAPSLAEIDRRWVMIDIDNWPLPGWADLADDPEGVVNQAIHELLPQAFHNAEAWWQLSASAGFAQGFLKAHIWFWLSEPASNKHLKAVLEQHAPGVDRAPFNAAQPHFIADPIVEGGYDPLPRRAGWRKGLEAAVALPKPVAQPIRRRTVGTGAMGRSGDVMDALAYLGRGEAGQGFHAPLRAATLRYARHVARRGEHARDDDALKAHLRAAIRSAPRAAGEDVETTYCQDYYLDRLITGAFALLAGDEEVQIRRPHHNAPAATVQNAREETAKQVSAFLDRALAWHERSTSEAGPGIRVTALGKSEAEQAALVVGVGLGKSTAARNALPAFIKTAKAEPGRPHRVLWLVPTHKLGNETEELMRALGLNVAVWRGRDADEPGTGDPENEIPPQKMCLNLDAVNDALRLTYDVERHACGSVKPGDQSCPFHALKLGAGGCAYQRQKPALPQADVIIASHQALFHPLPKEIASDLALVIVDESWWQNGLHPDQPVRLSSFADEVAGFPVRKRLQPPDQKFWRMIPDDDATADLLVLARLAQDAFEATPDGELVSREALVAAGLTPETCLDAAKMEDRRRMEGMIWPGMPTQHRMEAVNQALGNAAISRRAVIWKVVASLLAGQATHTGRLQLGTRSDKEGPFRVVLLHSRREVQDGIQALPMLCLDATMPTQIVRHYLPRLEVLAEVHAVTAHMTVHQITGGWGKSSMVPNKRQDEAENNRRRNLVAELADFVRVESAGNAFVVTYEAIEREFAGAGIHTGHFNAIAGLDSYGDADSVFVIGRPLPDATDVRAMALALTGEPIPEERGERQTRGALMADGSGAGIEVRAYENPDLEAIRVAIMDAEVVQAIGRGRGCNRSAANPLRVFVMADVTLPLPLHKLCRWCDIRPGIMARMLARGAVYLGPTDAAKAYPDLFPSPDAARMAIQRAGAEADFPNNPLRYTYLGECSGIRLIRASYRPAGRGQQNRVVIVPEDRLAGLQERLAELVGPLVHFALIEPHPPHSAKPPNAGPPADPPHCAELPPDQPDDPGWQPDIEPAELAAWEPDPGAAAALAVMLRPQMAPRGHPAWLAPLRSVPLDGPDEPAA